ncbi:MAG: hypothetical protein V4632_02455 [Pseudomonadota bacterium]
MDMHVLFADFFVIFAAPVWSKEHELSVVARLPMKGKVAQTISSVTLISHADNEVDQWTNWTSGCLKTDCRLESYWLSP